MRKKGSRVHADLYLDPEKHEQLLRLSQLTRVPMAVFAREALDDLLDKYADILERQGALGQARTATKSPRRLLAIRRPQRTA